MRAQEQEVLPPESGDSDHDRFQMLLSLSLDGELGQPEAGLLESHLDRCGLCRAEWTLWQAIDRKLRSAPMPRLAPDFSQRVALRLARQERARNVQIGLLLTVLTVFVWSLGLAGICGLAGALIYTNLNSIAAAQQFFVDAWAVGGVVGQSLWDVVVEMTTTPTALNVVSAYMVVTALALAVWFLLIQRSVQPARSRA